MKMTLAVIMTTTTITIAHCGEANPVAVSAQWQRVKPRRRLDGEEGDDDNK